MSKYVQAHSIFLAAFLTFLSWTADSRAETFLVEMKRPLNQSELKVFRQLWGGQLERFDSHPNPYFQRLYIVDSKVNKDLMRTQSLVQRVESTDPISPFSVEPSEAKSTWSDDPLLPYQWGFENTGQIVAQDIDDITLKRKKGAPEADIDLPSAESIDRSLRRNVIIAVIDSGVDTDHPDIKENIFRNETECLGGEIPLNPKEDHDANDYYGDCKGWNFTGKDRKGTNRPIDDMGHGTHVAGIIAARTNNDIGISGISNKIKILPIKVFSGDKENKNGMGMTDRLAKAILYATRMRVDVVNLSLGWPIAIDKNYLREAIAAALNENIVVVAAAGNNNHSAPLLPCSLKDVICVGSIDNDNTVSAFSNYGSHVDVLAPGDTILSLYPMSLTPSLFSVQGYEIKSGTSQAAPFVSALAAILRSQNPGFSSQEIAHLIRRSSRPVIDKRKTFLAGPVSYKNALSSKTKDILLPDFKQSDRATYRINGRTARLNFRLINSTSKKISAPIQVQSLTPHVKAATERAAVTVPAHSSIEYPVSLKITDIHADSAVTLNIRIDREHYRHDITLIRDMTHDPEIEKISLPTLSRPNLMSLQTRHLSPAEPVYYTYELSEKKLQLEVLTVQSRTMRPIGKIEVNDVSRLLSFSSLDLDADGDLDYQVVALVSQNDINTLEYYNFDQSLRPLPSFAKMPLSVEGVLQMDRGLSYLHYKINGQNYAAPFFMATGPLPDKDQNPDPFYPPDQSEAERVYFFLPELDGTGHSYRLVTRALDTPERVKKWKKDKKLRPFSDVRVLHILPQTDELLHKNQIQLLISYGYDFDRTAAVLTVTLDEKNQFQFTWKDVATSGRVLDGFQLDHAIDLNFSQTSNVSFIGALQDIMWEKVTFLDDGQSHLSRLRSHDTTESINAYLKGFQRGSTRYSFLQTVSEILFTIEEDQHDVRTFSRPFHVSTFLPGFLFTEQSHALWYFGAQKNGPVPALYVDASQLTARHAYLITGSEDGLRSPIHMNINIPPHCLTMNPSLWGHRLYKFTMVCKVDDGWEMQLLPMSTSTPLPP